jgi:hypothetical protein
MLFYKNKKSSLTSGVCINQFNSWHKNKLNHDFSFKFYHFHQIINNLCQINMLFFGTIIKNLDQLITASGRKFKDLGSQIKSKLCAYYQLLCWLRFKIDFEIANIN